LFADGRLWHERDATDAARWDIRRSLLGSAVQVARDRQSVPVNELRRIGIIVNIDNDVLPFLEAQQRSGSFVQILLQKSFCTGGRKFCGLPMHFRVKMRGASFPHVKLTGDFANTSEAIR